MLRRTDTELFWVYFNVADEIYGDLTLDDLSKEYIEAAKEGARLFGLSWPPYLPEAEEYLNDNRSELT